MSAASSATSSASATVVGVSSVTSSVPRGTTAQLDEIIVLLSKICESRNARGQVFKAFNKAVVDLASCLFSAAEIVDFFRKLHDRLLKYDTVFRISAYRAIRYLLKSTEFINLFYQEGLHLIVVESLEREQESSHERMQALKTIRRCTDISPDTLQLAFVRSVVAVASDRDDKFRRICIDTLREICFRNPAISSFCGGFRVLFDALLQPDCFEMIDSIIATMLFLYDSPETRPFVDFDSNLNGLISVFTDFDSSFAEVEQRLRSARVAIVTLTRSWGGLHLLSQGDKGLRVLTRLLCDSKIAPEVQDVVLDVFADAIEPVVSRTNPYSKPDKLAGIRKLSTKHLHSKGQSSARRTKRGDDVSRSNSGSDRKSASPVLELSNDSNRNNSTSSPPTRQRGLSIDDDDDDDEFDEDIDFADSGSGDDAGAGDGIPGAPMNSSPRPSPRGRAEMSQYVIARNTSLTAFLSAEAAANLTADSDTAARNSLFDMTKQGHRRGVSEISDSVASAIKTIPETKTPTGVLSDSALVPLGAVLRGSSFNFKDRRMSKDESDLRFRGDPMYNLMDSYGVVLCSALLKAKLFQALCTLGTIGTAAISEKSRKILVNFMGVISRLFPDQICAQLLQDPSLIEFASTFASLKLSDRALKASQLLLSVANTFSLSRGRGGFTAPNIMAKVASTSSALTSDPEAVELSSQIQRDISLGTLALSGGKPLQSAFSPRSAYGASSIIASRLREHRVTRAASDIVDEVAHTSFSRVFVRSTFSSSPFAALQPARSRTMSDTTTHRSSLVNFFMGDTNAQQGTKQSLKTTPSTELLSLAVKNQTREDLIYEIKVIATPLMDKADFARQMEFSRVLGKDGKEPFKWDWSMVNDMLEYCTRNPDRLAEALKTKWVKRLSGFYRCSSDDKGYFANLDWYPSNLYYLESACNLYNLLVDQSNAASVGMSFLGTDRRGMLFSEILNEVELLIAVASRTANSVPALSVPFPASGPNGASAASTGLSSSRSVFRPYGCSQLMSREYFTLLGRLCTTASGRQLVESNRVYHHLSTLGQHPCLDYLSRTSLTAICFSDDGFISRNMLQILPASPRSSNAIKLYAHTIQHALLRARDPEANSWMIEIISAQLVYDNIPLASGIRVLEAFVQDCAYLKHFIAISPTHILAIPGCDNVLIRLLSIPDGLAYMSKLKWVIPNIKKWMQNECQTYASRVNEMMFDALCVKHRSMALNRNKDATPITVACRPYCLHPSAPRRYSWYPDGGVDTEGLLRAPWNIEVRIGTQPAGQGVSIGSMPPEYVRIDSYFDASELPLTSSGDIASDSLRVARVRGVVLDDRGLPSAVAVPSDRILSTCLLIGVCPVYRDGRVYCNPPSSSVGGPSVNANGATATGALDNKFSAASNAATQRRRYVRNGDNAGMFFNMETQTGPVSESVDPPLTYQTEHLQDWTYCKPAQRQSAAHQKELGGGCFSVEISGEPVVWIFSRYPPGTEKIPETIDRTNTAANQTGAAVYLIEVHYLLRLVTGDPTMVPIPRHMFGEISRTLAGCNLLVEQGVISALLADARPDARAPSPIESRDSIFDDDDSDLKDTLENPVSMDDGFDGPTITLKPDSNNESVEFVTYGDEQQRMKAAIWALGHIASNDHGCEIVLAQDPSFISWLIHIVTSSPSFSLRNICFAALGLISRSERADSILALHEWDSAVNVSCAAAMPGDLSVLFRKGPNDVIRNDKYTLPAEATHEATGAPRRSYLKSILEPHDPKDTEVYCDVMECIARLPGHILFRDNWSRLSQLKNKRPELFAKRSLYLSVHKLLSLFSFTLHVRRQIADLFTPSARLRT